MNIGSLRPLVKDQPNETLLFSLSEDSQLLKTQSQEFSEKFDYRNSKIAFFFETVNSPTAIETVPDKWELKGPPALLVSEGSATCGLSHREGDWPLYSLQRDHSRLVKFSSNVESEYSKVIGVLREMVDTAISS
ncbi:hypothetical protein EG329_008805 [Mollisiaceae sp. DMI_Dod_QoI]|nr:hypothetical protein EG329_008805 [Helotiales sp. DMI_Dod_QoI]